VTIRDTQTFVDGRWIKITAAESEAIAAAGFPEIHERFHAIRPRRGPHSGSTVQHKRSRIFQRDNYTCQECGLRSDGPLTLDHIVPLVDGGTNHDDNLRTLCGPCHRGDSRRENSRRRAQVLRGQVPERVARMLGFYAEMNV
jgi:5-methylcytosine-specific restriction endonuclease McrA